MSFSFNFLYNCTYFPDGIGFHRSMTSTYEQGLHKRILFSLFHKLINVTEKVVDKVGYYVIEIRTPF